MARRPRVVIPAYLHHLIQRGTMLFEREVLHALCEFRAETT